jgi:hypothetical protein
MLELPEDVTLFVLSYYNLFGDILASVVTTQVLKPRPPTFMPARS